MSYMSCPRCGKTVHESDFVHRGCPYCHRQHTETDGRKVVERLTKAHIENL